MAGGRIKGITIEISGDTTPLQKALSGVDKQLKDTQSKLKDVDKLLKLDPANTELLTQKQKALKDAIGLTKDRLKELKDAQSGVKEGSEEWDSLQREIADTEQKLKGLKDQYKDFGNVASQQLKAVGSKLQETGKKVTEFGEKFAPISGAAGAFGGALVKMGYDAVTNADELNTLSKQTGISTEQLQKMQYASELVDVSIDDITGALRKMKPKMTAGNETFEKLGISVKKSDGSLRDAEAVFYDAIGALSKISNETERDQLAMELFGKSADSLAGIIDDGGEGLRAYGEEAKSMGLILSQDTVDSLAETDDAIQRMKGNLAGTMAQIGADVASVLAPALEKAGEFIGQITAKLRELTPEQTEMILKIAGIVAAIAPVLIIGGKIISGIGSVISIVGSVVGVLGGPLTIAIAAAIAIGVLLYKNWDKIKAAAATLKDNLIKIWNNIKTSITNVVTAIKTKVTAVWNAIKTTITNIVNGIKNTMTNIWNGIKNVVTNTTENMRSMLQGKLNAIKSAYEKHGGGIKGVAAAAVEGIKQYWTAGFDAINALTGGKLNAIKSKFSNIMNSIKNVVSNAINKVKSAFNFHWSLPSLKLPHISVSGGEAPFGIGGKGSLPHFSINWYKKAMNDPVIFTSPTVLPTMGGMKGFGDAGAEVVMGLNKLRELTGTDERLVPMLGRILTKLDDLERANQRPIYLNGRQLNRSMNDLKAWS